MRWLVIGCAVLCSTHLAAQESCGDAGEQITQAHHDQVAVTDKWDRTNDCTDARYYAQSAKNRIRLLKLHMWRAANGCSEMSTARYAKKDLDSDLEDLRDSVKQCPQEKARLVDIEHYLVSTVQVVRTPPPELPPTGGKIQCFGGCVGGAKPVGSTITGEKFGDKRPPDNGKSRVTTAK